MPKSKIKKLKLEKKLKYLSFFFNTCSLLIPQQFKIHPGKRCRHSMKVFSDSHKLSAIRDEIFNISCCVFVVGVWHFSTQLGKTHHSVNSIFNKTFAPFLPARIASIHLWTSDAFQFSSWQRRDFLFNAIFPPQELWGVRMKLWKRDRKEEIEKKASTAPIRLACERGVDFLKSGPSAWVVASQPMEADWKVDEEKSTAKENRRKKKAVKPVIGGKPIHSNIVVLLRVKETTWNYIFSSLFFSVAAATNQLSFGSGRVETFRKSQFC